MTTQVDTVVLAGRLFSGQGSSLQDTTAIRISADKVVGTLPIETQWLDQLDPSVRVIDLRQHTVLPGLPGLEDITCLQDPHVVMKGGCVAVDNRVNASA